ncbi:MAG: hypothetical protein JEZ07_19260 [Phycisphaerae bacterium]|nr:hypothetical protein [Phycisphaerae bacterium]
MSMRNLGSINKIKFVLIIVLLAFQFCDNRSFASEQMSAISCQQPYTIDFSRLIGPEDLPGAPGFADPYVFCEDGKWFITSTYTVKRPMYMAHTTDFKKIDHLSLNLDLNQNYLRKHFKSPWLLARDIWGFVPYKHDDGKWHAYASIHIGGYKTFVCHFTPNNDQSWPITDWRLDKVLVGSKSKTAYETKVYSDVTGLYLVYVERLADGNNHIMAQRLLAPDMIDTSFKARAILSPEGLRSEDRNQPGSMQIVEGTNITHVVTPNGSKYVMFYSVGDFARKNYKLGVAYSDVLIPPEGSCYKKPKAEDKSNLWANSSGTKEVVYMLQTQIPQWYNYSGTLLKGPGLGNLVKYQENYYTVFHAHDIGKARGRWVWICPVTIDFTKSMDSWLIPHLPKTMN